MYILYNGIKKYKQRSAKPYSENYSSSIRNPVKTWLESGAPECLATRVLRTSTVDRYKLYRIFVDTCIMWTLHQHIQQMYTCLYHYFLGRQSTFLQFHSIVIRQIRLITKLTNTEQSSKGKGKTHKSTNRQNQSTTGKLGKPQWP